MFDSKISTAVDEFTGDLSPAPQTRPAEMGVWGQDDEEEGPTLFAKQPVSLTRQILVFSLVVGLTVGLSLLVTNTVAN